MDRSNNVNPYLSKFGSDWDSKLTASSNVKQYRNVIELAEYMVEEGLKIFPDGNFHFYHDALSLLTAKGTKAEMEKGVS